jgi:hypothetical protein
VIAVLAVKAVEKGFRSLKEEHLHDYNARKANIDAAEKAMWDEVSNALWQPNRVMDFGGLVGLSLCDSSVSCGRKVPNFL